MPSRRRGRRRFRALLRFFGLGAAGVAGYALLSGERRRARLGEPGATPEPPAAPGPEARAGWVPGPVGSLFVVEAGDGDPPVLLIHGLGGRSDQWHGVLEILARRHRVVALDLRGHGRSDPSMGGSYTLADYAADARAAADATGLARFAVAGHSLGASVALELTAQRPPRVTALLLVDPPGDLSGIASVDRDHLLAAVEDDPHGEFRFHYRQFLLGAGAATRRRVLADLAATPGGVLSSSFGASLRYDPKPALSRFDGPVLCLASPINEGSTSLPAVWPELACRRLAGSHWLPLDRPEAVAEAVAELVVGTR